MRLYFFILINFLAILSAYGQCDPVIIDFSDSLCINEEIVFENNMAGISNIEWDFCPESLINPFGTPEINEITGSIRPFALDHIMVGGFHYLFIVGWSNNLIRVKFTNGLKSAPDFTDLGNISSLMSTPQGMGIHEEGGNYYILVNNRGGGVLRVDIGNDIENNAPVATEILSLASIGDLRGLTIENEGGNIYAIVAAGGNSGELVILDFGSSITNIPVNLGNGISLPRFPTAVSMYRECDTWFGVVTSSSNSRVTKINFGNSLTNTPSSQILIGILTPTGISLQKDFGNYYAFTNSASSGNIFRIDFGNSLADSDFEITDLGDLGVNNWAAAYQIIKVGSIFYSFAAGFDDHNLQVVEFTESCVVTNDYSMDVEPTGISYGQGGWQRFETRITNASNLTVTFEDSVYIRSSPVVDFSVSNNCEGQVAQLTDLSTTDNTNIVSWAWDFDDPASGADNSSTLQNPTHQFTSTGDYNVELQVTDDCGSVSNSTISVKVFAANDLQPDFVVPVGQCTNAPVLFSDASTTTEETIVGWLWDFGDPGSGSDNTSTLQNPSHVFSTPGNYDISLTITGNSGCQQTIINPGGSQTIIIAGPNVDFSFENTCAGDPINFLDETTGSGLISWLWDFGNGVTSTQQNPVFFYPNPGDYDVSLTVENSDGCTSSFIQSITIYGIPQVAFSNDLACSGESTQFQDLTTVPNANPVMWAWDFGDGTSSSVQNPFHQFPGPGDYTVKLAVTSNFGCIDSLEQVITVNSTPIADFDYNQVCSGQTVFFQDLSDAGPGEQIIDWLWQIDGQFVTEQNPEFLFISPGDFLVELIVTSSNLCTESYSEVITINEQPSIDFNPINTCSNQFTSFQNLSTPGTGDQIISYLWDFDGLGASTQRDPQFVFTVPGTYTVTLDIETQNGCTRSLSQQVPIELSPIADFEVSAILGSPPMQVDFTNNSQNSSSFEWQFGTGDGSTESDPSYVFNEEGTYEVLLVSTNTQCRDTARQLIQVVEPDLDVSLDALLVTEDNGMYSIDLTITNRGTTIIDQMDIVTDIGGDAKVSEAFPGIISVGETVNYTLSVNPVQSRGLRYLCIELMPESGAVMDSNPSNNRKCLNLEELFIALPAYPNPVQDLVNLDFVVPVQGEVELELLDLTGKRILIETRTVSEAGLISLRMDVSTVRKGVYLVRSHFENTQIVQKIILQ